MLKNETFSAIFTHRGMATTILVPKSTHVNLAQAWPNYRFVMQNCSSLIYGFSQQNLDAFSNNTNVYLFAVLLKLFFRISILFKFNYPSFTKGKLQARARRSMSKEKVALLQKTFSLRARASIDDCPIKNGSYTVFENQSKNLIFQLLTFFISKLKFRIFEF